jgi:hypothetical protein
MGQASASSSSTSGIQADGSLTVNRPNTLAWIIGGLVVAIIAGLWLKNRK